MSEIKDISFIFGEGKEDISLKNIKELLIVAILDPNESIRLSHIETLNKRHKNSVQRGFVADNQLCIRLGEEEGDLSRTYCLCDMPKTYCGRVREPHRFYRDENNRFISM